MGLSSVGIDFDTVVRSQLPRSFFVSPLNDPSFVARGGIEIHARRRRRRRHKGAQNLHRSQRQRGTAAATIRERRITIQLSAAAVARRRTQKSRTVSSFAISSGAEIDDRDAASPEMGRNCANVATCMRNSLLRMRMILNPNRAEGGETGCRAGNGKWAHSAVHLPCPDCFWSS